APAELVRPGALLERRPARARAALRAGRRDRGVRPRRGRRAPRTASRDHRGGREQRSATGAASAPARTARANAAVVSPPRARGADRVSHARPWLRPPALRTPGDGGDEERHASWLELFFDLVFVVAIAQLAQELARDHSLGGFAIFAGLFLPVFIAWQGFTFYADRFDSDDVLFRAV